MEASQNILRRSAILSAGLHVFVLALALLGILDYQTDVVDIAQPMPVELVTEIDELSQSPDPSPPVKDPVDKPQKKPKVEKMPEKVSEVVVEKVVDAKRPEPLLQEIPEKKVDPDVTLPKKLTEPPKVKPKPPVKPAVKPKPKKKKVQKKKVVKKRDFDALLKNLTKDAVKSGGKGGVQSDRLAASELDLVRKQIESVWRLPAGSQGAHRRTIAVRIMMNPNRMVRSATLVNPALMSDPGYRLLAESALRAINEFKFQPLKLPPNKYKVWKEIRMDFDPRNLL